MTDDASSLRTSTCRTKRAGQISEETDGEDLEAEEDLRDDAT